MSRGAVRPEGQAAIREGPGVIPAVEAIAAVPVQEAIREVIPEELPVLAEDTREAAHQCAVAAVGTVEEEDNCVLNKNPEK